MKPEIKIEIGNKFREICFAIELFLCLFAFVVPPITLIAALVTLNHSVILFSATALYLCGEAVIKANKKSKRRRIANTVYCWQMLAAYLLAVASLKLVF